MSIHETPMIRWYWNQVGGTLIEEYTAVPQSKNNGPRRLDAIIIKNGEKRIAKGSEIDFKNKDIIVIQAKLGRLGMSLMGQALFSMELMKRFSPRSIESIALCSENDIILCPLLEKKPGLKVVVYENGSLNKISNEITNRYTWDHNDPGNQDGFINSQINKQKLVADIVKEFAKNYSGNEKPKGRVMRHINHLLRDHPDFPYYLENGTLYKKK